MQQVIFSQSLGVLDMLESILVEDFGLASNKGFFKIAGDVRARDGGKGSGENKDVGV